MVAQNGIGGDALDAAVSHIDGVDIAEEGVGGRFGQSLLEGGVGLLPGLGIVRLPGLGQGLVHLGVGVAGVICALVGAEHLVGVVVGVKGGAPADDAALLGAPVDAPGGDVGGDLQPGGAQLLGGDLGQVDAHLVAGGGVDHETNALPAAAPVALAVPLASGVQQQLLRPGRIIVVALHVGVVVYVALQGTVGHLALAQQHRVYHLLPVDQAADGGDQVGVFLPVFVPEIVEDAPVIGGGLVVYRVHPVAFKQRRVLGGHLGQVQLPGAQLQSLHIVVGDDLEDDAVDLRRPGKIVLVLFQDDGLSLVPLGQLIGAGAYRGAEEIGLLHVLSLQKVLGEDGHGHVFQESIVGSGQTEGNGVGIHHRDLLHILVVGGVFGAVVRVHDGLNGEFYILGGEFLTVVPLDALLQVEGIGQAFRVIFPGSGQPGNDVILAVVVGQAVKEQHIDLAVLVHGGVDAGIVAGAVDNGAGLLRPRAGEQTHAQRQGQQHRDESVFSHVCDSFRSFCYGPILSDAARTRKPPRGLFPQKKVCRKSGRPKDAGKRGRY